jgi:nucleoside-diphosphate-sugar epimerase
MSHEEVILVTGSSGLIGNAVAARLASSYKVVGFDRTPPSRAHSHVYPVPVDLTSEEDLSRAFKTLLDTHGNRLTSVIHLAAYFDFSGEPNKLYDTLTVEGTRRLLQRLAPLSVEQFIFSSTMLVHAPCLPGQFLTEESPLDPRWDYPISKVKAEQVIHSERGSIPAVSLRIGGVYTDRCNCLPLAHQIQRIYERWLTSRVFPGPISHGQAFVHLDDLVDAFVATVERRKSLPPECAILIGEPEPLTYDELQHQFARLIHNEDWETTQIPKAVAKAGAWVQNTIPIGEEPFIKPWMIDYSDDHYALDITRAQRLLGWTPQHSLRTTLPKMIAALQTDPENWYREHHLDSEAIPDSLPA